MSYKTADEVRDEYVQAMGTDVGAAYFDLYNTLSWLHVKWQQYRQLFADETHVDVLNQTAPMLFGSLQRTLFDDVMLHLARITDAPTMMGRENLTVQMLP